VLIQLLKMGELPLPEDSMPFCSNASTGDHTPTPSMSTTTSTPSQPVEVNFSQEVFVTNLNALGTQTSLEEDWETFVREFQQADSSEVGLGNSVLTGVVADSLSFSDVIADDLL
jgi:hypothetical protein